MAITGAKVDTQHAPTRSKEQEAAMLEGLPPTCWAAYVRLSKKLVTPDGDAMDGKVWLSPTEGTDPVLHDVIGIDLGKAQFKGGGVDDTYHFRSTITVDAYCTARAVQHEKKKGTGKKGITTWKLLSEQGRSLQNPKGYWIGIDALMWADKLPLAEISVRIRETRFREMFYAAIVEQLREMGRTPSSGNGESADSKTLYVIASLGLPYKDVTPLNADTKAAIRSLFGPFTLERTDTYSGETETWQVHLTDAFAFAQTRGTDDAWGMQLDGESSQTEVTARTIIDPGGGDSHAFHVTEDGHLTFIGSHLGAGTIELAEGLIAAVQQELGITLSEPAAQMALYTKKIRGTGGRMVDITPLIAGLSSRFDNLLTRLQITEEMKTTLVIFTGGGTALLHDQLKEKLKAEKLVEGNNYIVVPAEIAPIMNVIGLTARGIYKAQALEIDYTDGMLATLTSAYAGLLQRSPLGEWNLRQGLSRAMQQLQDWQNQTNGIVPSWPQIREYRDKLRQLTPTS